MMRIDASKSIRRRRLVEVVRVPHRQRFRFISRVVLCSWVILVGIGCAAPAPTPPSGAPRDQASQPAPGPKRLTVAIAGEPHTLYQKLNPQSTVRGIEELEQLVHTGFSTTNSAGALVPQLAEAVPSIENGRWRVLPDGRMELTWTIREGALWHDGTPVTAADAVFAATLGRDRELPIFRDKGWDFVEQVEAGDARTVVVTWTRPYVEADSLFSSAFGQILPSHILAGAYAADKASLIQLPYWTEEFVGAGPYRLRDFTRGNSMVLEANPRYVLGRPKIDVIETLFIVDSNTLVANVLAGTVDLTLSRGISFDQAIQVRSLWREGHVEIPVTSLLQVFPQLLTPSPVVIGDVQFRRALMHAIDRDELASSLQSGLAPVAHSFVSPEDAEYRHVEWSIVRFVYDPRRAAQLVEGLGYTRGADGMYRDPVGAKLTVEIRATGTDINQKTMLSVADHWKRLGIEVETVAIPPQLASDLEYRAIFPGFAVQRQGAALINIRGFTSAQTPLPENRWLGNNYPRYMNPEFDALVERFDTTLPFAERMAVGSQAVQHLTDRVIELPLFFDGQPALVSNRLVGLTAGGGGQKRTTWNAHEWDLR
jgi:peptide/nickel transport system substrate-binding protein